MLHFRTDKLVTIILLVLDIVKKKKKPRNIAPFDLIHASKRAWKFELEDLVQEPFPLQESKFCNVEPPSRKGNDEKKEQFYIFFFSVPQNN